jgi:hypothetical protein
VFHSSKPFNNNDLETFDPSSPSSAPLTSKLNLSPPSSSISDEAVSPKAKENDRRFFLCAEATVLRSKGVI